MESHLVTTIQLLLADGELPTGTFEWIIKNGIAGLLLVICAIEGWVIWRLLHDMRSLEIEYRGKIEKLKDDQAAKVEALMNSRIAETEKTQVLLAENREAMKKMLKLAGDD